MRRVSVPGSRVLVAGAGASALVAALAAAGDREVVAADISSSALKQLRDNLDELGVPAESVQMIVGNICDIGGLEQVDVWHDRAVFHFLNDSDDQRRYVAAAAAMVRPGGHLVIATFSPNGPEQCSGLPVTRHSAESLADTFADGFDLLESFERDHLTPWGSTQSFTHAVLRRRL